MDLCKKFSITGAKEVFEGHFGKLLYLYNKIKSEGIKPSEPIFEEFDSNIEFDFSFIGPTFFESNLSGFDLENYSNQFEPDGIEPFFLSAKSNLNYS